MTPPHNLIRSNLLTSSRRRIRVGPVQYVTYGSTRYEVEEILQDRNNDPSRMSNGVRVLRSGATGFCIVEKKVITSYDYAYNRTNNEIAALMQIREAGGSPHINGIYDVFWHDNLQNCTILLEHCNRYTLAEKIDRSPRTIPPGIDEAFCWHVLEGMTTALAMLHYGVRNLDTGLKYQLRDWNTVVHLDIKPMNVFLTSRHTPGFETVQHRVVLGDFGCAITKKSIEDGTQQPGKLDCATAGWTPPEIKHLRNGGWEGDFGKPMDVWQTGGVIQCLCRLLTKPNQGKAKEGRPCSVNFSPELNKVVAAAMIEDQKERPTTLDLWEEIKLYKKQWEQRSKPQVR